MRPKLALTMGDPAGIGPEIIAKALSKDWLEEHAVIIVGVPSILSRAFELYSLEGMPGFKEFDEAESWSCGLRILSMNEPKETISWACVSGLAGGLALESIKLATELCLKGHAQAIVTTPVSKEAIEDSGVPFDGHTGYIAKCCGVDNEMMMMSFEGLNVGYVTTHIPLSCVSSTLTQELILDRLKLSWQYLLRLREAPLKIAVCGLNPHAGEGGHLGLEEIEVIQPAIKMAREAGIDCHGPFPADTIFVERFRKPYGVILALYHDQGGIPFKMLAFDHGVNHTLGLPIVRTSVDHGTAWDIAWQGKASEASLISALTLAERLVQKVD